MRTMLLGGLVALVLGGCTTKTTTIHFTSPVAAEMRIGLSRYEFPAEIDFSGPQSVTGQRTHAVKVRIAGEKPMRLRGEIHIFSYYAHDVDEYAVHKCDLSRTLLDRLADGAAIVILGHSAGSGQVVYKLILGLD